MILREANKEDLLSIGKVQVDSNRSTYVGIMPEDYLNNLSYKSKASEWDEKLFNDKSTQFMYVAEADDGNIIGFASGSLVRTNDLFEREIYSIYILKEFQRKGTGMLLIKAIITKYIEIYVCFPLDLEIYAFNFTRCMMIAYYITDSFYLIIT